MSDAKQQPAENTENAPNFINELVAADVAAGEHDGRVHTRFPPEPNGYLHIGHAKAICIDFGVAQRFGGKCNLRFDDTNPVKEDTEFVDAIKEDVRWLGFDWAEREFFASDYFERLYDYAVQLIQAGLAYVDSSTADEIREMRGDFYRPGTPSPFRDRSVEENLDMFARMRAGEFQDGTCVLRAKIDMASGNLNLRDPTLYRIKHAHHHRTGDAWCIYPMYDFAHTMSDAIEGITHSLCSLEFEAHRPLYDWFIEQLKPPARPVQTEFARLKLTHTVMSKRKLQRLVAEGHVDGWDDPRMPTLSGLRRRGVTPEAIVRFCERVGVSKRDSVVDPSLLDFILREDLNARAPRAMAVLNPLKVVIENYPEGESETFEAVNHPEYPERGVRQVPFSRVLYIERDDFRMDAPKKWFRLSPGREVRLRYACLITCREAVTDSETGEVVELRCTWDPESRGGTPADGRRVKGTLHWVSAEHAVDAEVRLYDRLFLAENPDETPAGKDFVDGCNPDSLTRLHGCKLEPSLGQAEPGDRVQFERLGYFCADLRDSKRGAPVFNRTIPLRDTWAKVEAKL